MQPRWRGIVVLVAVVASLCGSLMSSIPAGAEEATAEQQLAERYVPIAYLKTQNGNCDRKGEAYFPAPLEVIWGNPEIALKHREGASSAEDPIVMVGPMPQDLAGLGEDYYLDFPGNPRHPGCGYEIDFKRFAAAIDAKPTTYAHISIDQESGQLIV